MRNIALTCTLVIMLALPGGTGSRAQAANSTQPLCVIYRVMAPNESTQSFFRVDPRSGTVTEADRPFEPIPLQKEIYNEYQNTLSVHNFAALEGVWVDVRAPIPPQFLAQQDGTVYWGMQPVYSPDGQHLAVPSIDYSANCCRYRLSVADRNGLNPVALFSTGFAKFPPDRVVWSADGTFLAVRAYSMMDWHDCYFVRTDNGTFRDAAHAVMPGFAFGLVANDVEWAPDGHIFAALTAGAAPALTLATPDGGVLISVNLPLDADYYLGSLGWSADGNYVSASYRWRAPDRTVWRLHTILKMQGNTYSEIRGGRFANPDHDSLIFVNYWLGNRFVFARYNPATSTNDLVAFDPATNEYATLATRVIRADYNRDNQAVTFQRIGEDGLTLTRMNADGSHQISLVQGAAAIWPVGWWGHNGLAVVWRPPTDTREYQWRLTWATADGQYTGTSDLADEMPAAAWLTHTPYFFYQTRIGDTVNSHVVDLLAGKDYAPIPGFQRLPSNPRTFIALSPAQDVVVFQYAAEIYIMSLRDFVVHSIKQSLLNVPDGAIWSFDGSQFALIEKDSAWQYAWLDTFTPKGDLLHRVPLPSSGNSLVPISYTYCP